MKPELLRKMSQEELRALFAEKRSFVRTTRFGASSAKGKNVMIRRETKKDIARILTILKEGK